MLTVKKIMILGGSPFQVPLISKAKAMGLYVITCDYLPSNPGHALADEYYNVSTTDKIAVLNVAERCNIDAITTFSSDPAVPTVAHVAGYLGLPGPKWTAVEQLTEKDKFRKLMRQAGLNVPASFTTNAVELPDDLDCRSAYIVKPVDSSGSKGVSRSDCSRESLIEAIRYALSFSRSGRCIIEQYIDGRQVHGDAFVQDGKITYHYLGDHHFYTATNSFVPVSTRWPASISKAAMQDIIEQAETIVQVAGYLDGPINIEARIDAKGDAYIIEIGPRNGGNFVPIIQQALTGFDFTEAVIDTAIGKRCSQEPIKDYKSGAYYILHADQGGTFIEDKFPPHLERFLLFKELFKNGGDKVGSYTGSNQSIGVGLFKFNSLDERDVVMDEVEKQWKVLMS